MKKQTYSSPISVAISLSVEAPLLADSLGVKNGSTDSELSGSSFLSNKESIGGGLWETPAK
jgi:hypothetical protein